MKPRRADPERSAEPGSTNRSSQGNWKMHKTVAEAEAFIASAAAAGVLGRTASTSRSAPPSPRWARWWTAPGARAWKSSPRTCTTRPTAPSPARSPRRCSSSSTSSGVVLGHSERRRFFCETDEALGRKVPAALCRRAAPDPVRRGDRGGARGRRPAQVLRRQVSEDLAGVEADRLGDVVIAYEPVWAIGSGKVASPEQAQAAAAFVWALVGEREPRPHGCGSSTAAASSPTTRASCGPARYRRRAGGRRQARPRISRRSSGERALTRGRYPGARRERRSARAG